MFAFVVHAWRSWKSAKAVGLLAVVALAAGIGSVTAIYTVIDAVLVQPVPWQHSERFVALFSATLDSTSRGEWASTAWLDLVDYQQRKPGDFDAWSRWAAKNPEHLVEIQYLRAIGAALAVPLLAKNEIAGILLLGPPVGRAEFSAAEKRALQSCAGQFALMLENARLTDRMVEQEKLNRDIQLAAEVQKRLFPDKPPSTTAVTLAGVSLPARSVGGDYYDFFDLGGQRIGMALADVAGKGVAAALIMSVVQASLRILATEVNVSLAALAARMNRFLHRSTGSNAYATFFYAQIDERVRQR